jgi:hypothetical protein
MNEKQQLVMIAMVLYGKKKNLQFLLFFFAVRHFFWLVGL